MGRHAAERPEPDPSDPESRAVSPGTRLPLHADLFAPSAGGTAEQDKAQRVAETFDRLVQPHRAALLSYVKRLTDGDDALAESIVKETLYRAVQDPSRCPKRSSALGPWLVLTARNVLRDGQRYAPAGHDDRPDMSRLEAERSTGPVVPGTTVVGALEELSEVHRKLLVELFYDGVTLEQAAYDRGISVETLKSGLYFAMRSLRAVLDQQLADRHGPQ
ncbi:MAG: polymerase sigma-70 factor, subfamily [Actinoplanes sp.]|jgi:RNA polymerase sigma-70 factor (ECF subfamily)|nr:polymerase sigma-70 factor, subfamily [Actinoplanes sp.]